MRSAEKKALGGVCIHAAATIVALALHHAANGAWRIPSLNHLLVEEGALGRDGKNAFLLVWTLIDKHIKRTKILSPFCDI